MKFGFNLAGRGPLASADSLVRIANKGEELGFDAVLMGDHILVPKKIDSTYPYTPTGEFPGGGAGDAMEMITLLAYVAGQTKKIRLVTSVLIVPYRPALLAAKALATLDVLSGGRLVVGIGVGWMEEEFEALDIPPYQERGAVTDEYIRAFKELWTSDDPHFHGKYVSFDDIHFLPKPAQKPHPPIWVGGESRPALRRTAELANGWYPIGSNPSFPMGTPEQLTAGLQRLAEYARRFDRDPAEIEIIYRAPRVELQQGASSSGDGRVPFIGNAEQLAGDIRQYEGLGVSSMVVDFGADDLDSVFGRMERFADQVMTKL